LGAILAILGEAGNPELAERLQRMLARSPYRGKPEFLVDGPLAIGIQSMGWDASLHSAGNWLVAFHGYIGNWDELAVERGWRFPDGASNAEKISVAFEDMGNRLFGRLRGEWAALIWNRRERTLLAARDVIGCRPLFVHKHRDAIYVATEIRQVLAGSEAAVRLNPNAPADFLLLRFPENGRTFFEGVGMLPGGVVRELHSGPVGEEEDFEFWGPPPMNPSASSSEELAEELQELLDVAVRRATPESGAGVSLSGGLDSGSVWGTLASQVSSNDLRSGKYRPFSNVYPGMPCDETPYIRSVLDFTGTDGILVDSAGHRGRDYLSLFCEVFDWPSLPNCFALELICKAASKEGQSVLLTGLGGDNWLHGSLDYVRELFYSGHMIGAVLDLMRVRLPSSNKGFFRKIFWLSPGLGLTRLLPFLRGAAGLRQDIVADAHREVDFPICGSWDQRVGGELLSQSQRTLLRGMDRLAAVFILEFCELQAARHGIEIRHPLMDADIVDFAFATDPRSMVEGRCFKHLLRRAMMGRLPAAVLARIERTAFNCLFEQEVDLLQRDRPVADWELVRRGILDGDQIDSHLSRQYNKRESIEIVCALWVEVFVRRAFSMDRDRFDGGTVRGEAI